MFLPNSSLLTCIGCVLLSNMYCVCIVELVNHLTNIQPIESSNPIKVSCQGTVLLKDLRKT